MVLLASGVVIPSHAMAPDWLGREDHRKHLILAASGSVATIKLASLIRHLDPDISICVVLTQSARRFFTGSNAEEQPSLAELTALPNVVALLQDEDEWSEPWTRGAKILHIELRRWADMLVIAPLSANSLAKIANGLCDNLLTNLVRAWDHTDGRPMLVAPAMNTAMWTHPITKKHMAVLGDEWGVRVLQPVTKQLACGDIGDGAMCDVGDIVTAIGLVLVAA